MSKTIGLQFKAEKTLNKMNKDEITAIALEKGIEIPENANKKEIIELINKVAE